VILILDSTTNYSSILTVLFTDDAENDDVVTMISFQRLASSAFCWQAPSQ